MDLTRDLGSILRPSQDKSLLVISIIRKRFGLNQIAGNFDGNHPFFLYERPSRAHVAVMGRGIACGSFCVRRPPAAHLGGPAGALNRSSGYMKRLRRRAPRGRPAVPTQIKISLRGGPGFDRTLEVHAAHAHDHAHFVRRIAVCEPPRSCFWSRDHPPEPPR